MALRQLEWFLGGVQEGPFTRAAGRCTSSSPGPPVHDDLVLRDVTAPPTNALGLTDTTEHSTAAGQLYLCAVWPSLR
jgi:hypothetical protein